jgi:hypothetical protein
MRAGTSQLLAGLLASAALAAVPATASAQSAGDEQYADPFREEPRREQPQQPQQPQQPAGSGTQPVAPATGSQQSGTTPAPAQSDGRQEATGPGLPYSGLPAGLLGGAGLALLAAGAALRRRL